jgi:hypothetical protein
MQDLSDDRRKDRGREHERPVSARQRYHAKHSREGRDVHGGELKRDDQSQSA